jgi:hypothetical protein
VGASNDLPGPDEFGLRAWFLPADAERKILRDAARLGTDGHPDVFSRPIQTPPGIAKIQSLVAEWCGNQCGTATDWFAPHLAQILATVDTLCGQDPASLTEDELRHREALKLTLEELRGTTASLTLSLTHVVGSTVDKGNGLISQYWSELLHSHPASSYLDKQWDPPVIAVDLSHLDFGQAPALAAFAEWDEWDSAQGHAE